MKRVWLLSAHLCQSSVRQLGYEESVTTVSTYMSVISQAARLWRECHYCQHIYVSHQSGSPAMKRVSLLSAHLCQSSVRQPSYEESVITVSTSMSVISQTAQLWRECHYCQHIYVRHQSDSTSLPDISETALLLREYHNFQHIYVRQQSDSTSQLDISEAAQLLREYYYCQHIYVRQQSDSASLLDISEAAQLLREYQ